MKDKEFREYMEKLGTMQKRPVSDAVSRCKRIERDLGVDLDNEYLKDKGKTLIVELEYSFQDAINKVPLPGKLSFPGNPENVKHSMDTLRSAIKKYMEFKNL